MKIILVQNIFRNFKKMQKRAHISNILCISYACSSFQSNDYITLTGSLCYCLPEIELLVTFGPMTNVKARETQYPYIYWSLSCAGIDVSCMHVGSHGWLCSPLSRLTRNCQVLNYRQLLGLDFYIMCTTVCPVGYIWEEDLFNVPLYIVHPRI